MAEPQLFPNQPNVQEHIQKNKTEKKEDVDQTGGQLNIIVTRLKILEERYGTLRKKMQTTEHNVVSIEKNHYEDLRLITDDLTEIKHKMRDITEKVSLLTDEIQQFATRNDFQVLDKFVNYWQPLDFVTRKEVNDFLRKRFSKQKQQDESHMQKQSQQKVDTESDQTPQQDHTSPEQ